MSDTNETIEQRRREWLAETMREAQYGQHGHTITLCDATTGHSVTNVAFCDEELRAEVFRRAVNNHEALIKALEGLLANHVQLVSSGDCGNWNVEEEAEVIAARALLQAVQKGER